jgi:hypothetical protein
VVRFPGDSYYNNIIWVTGAYALLHTDTRCTRTKVQIVVVVVRRARNNGAFGDVCVRASRDLETRETRLSVPD